MFDLDRYLIRRKVLTILGAKFHVYDPNGQVVGYSQQKAFKLKEDIRVYSDESMAEELLHIQARNVIDFASAYDVVDPGERRKIGALRRKGWRSILRDSWEFLDENDHPIAKLSEDSMWRATLRRMIELIPQTFHAKADDGRTLVTYKQRFNPFVHKLDVTLSPDAGEVIDPRLALAAGVLLVAIEGRQKS